MRPTHFVLTALALAAGAALPAQDPAAGAQKPPPVVPSELESEYKALEKEFGDARRAFQTALQARYAERQKEGRELSAADYADDPTSKYVPRYREFARRAKGTEWGGLALLKSIELSRDKVDLASLVELVDVYANDSIVGARAAERLASMGWTIGSETAEGTLRRLIAASTQPKVQAAANYSLGTALMGAEITPGKEPGANTPEREAESRRLLALVAEKYADTRYAEQAKGALFELEHLVIGRTAPDFETVDENGKAWRLSDYRGKVTIIDFWGYW